MSGEHDNSATGSADPVNEQAIQWFARFRANTLGDDERARLAAWLAADEAHRAAYHQVEQAWSGLEPLARHPALLEVRERARQGTTRRTTRVKWAGLAAGVLLVFGAGLAYRAVREPSVPSTTAATTSQYLETARGQLATYTLADGSVVTLDTDSAVTAVLGGRERDIHLVRGRASFRVAHDASHPFVVSASGRTVTALGTVFDVYLTGGAVQVSLVEGRVRVQQVGQGAGRTAEVAAPLTTELVPGQRLLAADAGWRVQSIDPATALDWSVGRLAFNNATLAEIVGELNRYATVQIHLADETVAGRRMSAVLRSDDTGTFFALVEALHLGHVRAVDGGYQIVR